ncbi:MAG: T9SS type A sorting domain-containing protein [Niastella sp.]|nr:T9SS type A sorting domain-containing protein [Niastella sp.]
MKKLYTALFLLLSGILHSHAQGIYQFWGTTEVGGTDGQGVLFSSKYDGTGVRPHKAFELKVPGNSPRNNGLVNYNGRLLGVMSGAGERNAGIIYEYNPVTNAYTKLIDFYRITASRPIGSMVIFQNKLYGVTSSTIDVVDGVLYEYDPAINALSKKYTFQNGSGTSPNTGLVVYNNKLYGTTLNDNVLFSYDPVNSVYAKLAEFNSTVGFTSEGPLVPYNNRLYGVSSGGGLNGMGTLFEFNPANNTITKKADMSTIGAKSPGGGLVRINSKLYGGTWQGGINDAGTIFEYDIVQNTLVKKIDMSAANGQAFYSPFLLYNNKLYGLTAYGGTNDEGVLFEYDPATNTYGKKVNFNGPTMGSHPGSPLLVLNDRFYSVTYDGGSASSGALFEYNPVINGITKKIDLSTSATGHIPKGKLTYYSGKLYGITENGGSDDKGVIFSYDLATGTYAVRQHMTAATGYVGTIDSDLGGMMLYNNKLYGIAKGSTVIGGALYEFDPLNDNYTVKHHFSQATGYLPGGVPVLYNNKLYGTTIGGGNNGQGVLYEYDLATNTYAVRVSFGGSFGGYPRATLTLHNGRLYGTTTEGGANNNGTLFEYIPAGNGFVKRYDFSPGAGEVYSAGMVVYNNKLYGTTNPDIFQGTDGVLFEYDLATNTYTEKHQFLSPGGSYTQGTMMLYNNKLYGTMANGGAAYGGVLFEYDLVSDTYKEPTSFTSLDGREPLTTQLITVPALVARGTPGSCTDIGTTLINAANAGQWVPFTDEGGNAVLEINANGNILGNVQVQFYTHSGATRQDEAGRLYLDRNITIKVDNQPASPVSVRFYIRKAEFESLKNTPSSGVINVSDLTLFKNSDACGEAIVHKAAPLTSTVTTWGLDYVYTAQVSSFSTFYVASKSYLALPVKLEYLKGAIETSVNKLNWKASCTEKTDFIVERSTDGIHFGQIGVVPATVIDCGNPFQFTDQQIPQGKAWYRLQMKEAGGNITYSNILLLDRGQGPSLNIQLTPNPVTGSQAIFTIYSPGNKSVSLIIYDATGKSMNRVQWQLQPGSQVRTIDVHQLPAGIYQAVWFDGNKNSAIRFIKQ